jgi:hypothetical protein
MFSRLLLDAAGHADASLLINATEILRPENDYEHFATTTAR